MNITIQDDLAEIDFEKKNIVLRYLWHGYDNEKYFVQHFLVSYKERSKAPNITKVVRRETLVDWFEQTIIPFNAKVHGDVLLVDFLDPTIFGTRFVSIRKLS